MDAELEQLVDLAVTEAELSVGVSPSVVRRRAVDGRPITLLQRNGHSTRRANANRWTAEDEQFVRDSLGKATLDEIGSALGRSAIAVKIFYTRRGLLPGSKQPHEITGNRIARMLQTDVHSVMRLIDRGILPGRLLPGLRRIRVVEWRVFQRWLLDPRHWMYFKAERIQDARLRRLVELRQARWPDAWITTGQAGAMLGIGNKSIEMRILRGTLPGVKWGNWRVLRSDVERIRIGPGRGSPGMSKSYWSREGDVFLVLGAAIGLNSATLARMMGIDPKRSAYRLTILRRTRLVRRLLAVHPELSQVHFAGGRLFADWRWCAARFPGVVASVNRLLAGERLRTQDCFGLWSIMRAWAGWSGRENAKVQAGLKMFRCPVPGGFMNQETTVRRAWARLCALGINPFGATSDEYDEA